MKMLEPRTRLQRFSGLLGFLAIVSGVATIVINFQTIFLKNFFIVLTDILWLVFIVSWIASALNSGTVHMRSGQADRATEPFMFWSLFVVLTLFWLGIYWWMLTASWNSLNL